jgi:D-sedoheptulose 7-phosphate isomerase
MAVDPDNALRQRDGKLLRPSASFTDYASRLGHVLQTYDWSTIERLALSCRQAWKNGHQVFLCGNGGSAANAMHIANDLLYGVASKGAGIRVTALSANSSVLTCLANDLGYDEIFSRQLKVHGSQGDVLIVLSGSGNSPNVVKAIEQASALGIQTFAILGYGGGKCLKLADVPIHFPVDDMQLSEDLQLVVGHMLMQWLCANPPDSETEL